ncbi:NfeD family protein [Salaquimonas pukyongi]|uniref:NfeD family protein n=1 Tax=Salaquimonas pukyongi TaxID=2712698 RepID=UPI00096B7547|nr:NfeD family protein [Salaquimonas pukyongi]
MIVELVRDLGGWSWWVLGAILIGIEVLAPGTFFLWLGLAAFAVGAVSLIVGPEAGFWAWQVQLMAFAILSLVFAFAGRSLMRRKDWDRSEAPDLNERGKQLVGSMAVLTQPIAGGRGRAKIGDTTWRVTGPDLPQGAKVKVVGANAETLEVEAAGK